MEIFKDVVGYEDLFQISNFGRVFSKRTNKILKQVISKTGYFIFATKIGGRGGKNVCFKVHRLIANAFIDNPENKPFVNHIDGNKLNNAIENLEWVTAKENSRHAVDTGLLKTLKGFDNPNTKLTLEEAIEIKSKYIPNSREFGARALGREYGVCHSTITWAISLV